MGSSHAVQSNSNGVVLWEELQSHVAKGTEAGKIKNGIFLHKERFYINVLKYFNLLLYDLCFGGYI